MYTVFVIGNNDLTGPTAQFLDKPAKVTSDVQSNCQMFINPFSFIPLMRKFSPSIFKKNHMLDDDDDDISDLQVLSLCECGEDHF